jgi:PleD family two-component response regulator
MTIKGKILAVDGPPASLKLLTELLQTEGYEVRSAIRELRRARHALRRQDKTYLDNL